MPKYARGHEAPFVRDRGLDFAADCILTRGRAYSTVTSKHTHITCSVVRSCYSSFLLAASTHTHTHTH